MQQFRMVEEKLKQMAKTSQIEQNKKFIQHGTTTLYTHCRNVAMMSLKIASFFKAKVDVESLITGALLHDYYLYDWHDRKKCPPLHGYFHPGIALKNAMAIYDLNKIEQDVIKHHMFPLTLCPPLTKEGWIVTLSDKLCSTYETFKMNERHLAKRRKMLEKKVEREAVRHAKKAAGFQKLLVKRS
jgi:uncharacterized protein